MRGLTLLAVALLCACARAQYTFTWNGGNTDFSNTDNWASGTGPTNATDPSETPCLTIFGGSNPSITVVSQLAPEQYVIGYRLQLPINGILRLATTGTVLTFYSNPANATASSLTCNADLAPYNWTGGLIPEQRNDFYCHLNWIASYSSTTPVPNNNNLGNLVPCADDVAVFPTGNSYKVFVPSNVSIVPLSSMRLDGVTYYTTSSLSTTSVVQQVNLVSTGVPVLIGGGSAGDLTACKAAYQISANNLCQCYSTCLDAYWENKVQSIIDAQINGAAAVQLAYDQNTANRNFAITFTPAALGLTLAQAQSVLFNNTINPTLVSGVVTALLGLPANAVISVKVNATAAGTVLLTGNINASNVNLYAPGQTSLPSPSVLLSYSVSVPSVTNMSQLVVISQTALSSLMLKANAQLLAQQLAQQQSSLPPAAQNLSNTLASTPNAAQLLNIANNDPCFSACSDDYTSCSGALVADFTAAGVDANTAQTLATQLIQSKNAVGCASWNTTSNTVNNVANQTTAVNNANNQANQATPQPFSGSTILYAGRTAGMSAVTQLQLVAPNNIRNVTRLLQASLSSSSYLTSGQLVSVTFVPTVPSGARRRRASTSLTSGLAVAFNYTVNCLPTDTTCQQLNPAARTVLLYNFNNQLNGLQITFPTCFDPNKYFTYSDSVACLGTVASAYCSAQSPINLLQAWSYIYNISLCGPYPANIDGTCYGFYQSSAAANVTAASIVANASGCHPIAPGAADSSSGGGGGLGMAAGAAGGGAAILIIIIIIVVMRRKKNAGQSNNSKRSDDRTVVAFENPMYDDPVGRQQQHPVLYDSGTHHESEGLYDEPAFSGTQKANPLYHSHEDLAAQGGDGVGYLDAGPSGDKSGGYLDVSPSAPHGAEDAGYLEQGEAEIKPIPTYDMGGSKAAPPADYAQADSQAPIYQSGDGADHHEEAPEYQAPDGDFADAE